MLQSEMESVAHPPGSASASPELVAYGIPGRTKVDIVPASRRREWMDQAKHRWPNRCLPLLMANESAWWLLNPVAFTATWDGGSDQSSLTITLDGPSRRDPLVASMFGYGILTWVVPALFRTDPGWNLLARGPANKPKDGISALEGLIETDWSTASFTMNWQLTRQGLPVRFQAGEPFCAIVPHRRRDLESFAPRKASLAEDRELDEAFEQWRRSRDEQMLLKFVSQYGTVEGFSRQSWQKDYFKGRAVDGRPAPEHQTKRGLRPFAEAGAVAEHRRGVAS